jgi:hypothetical protein
MAPLHTPILLVEDIFPKRLLWLEANLSFLLGLILVSMLLDGVLNQVEKLLFPLDFHSGGLSFTLWETDPKWIQEGQNFKFLGIRRN